MESITQKGKEMDKENKINGTEKKNHEANKKESPQRRRLSRLLNTNFKNDDVKIKISYKKVEN